MESLGFLPTYLLPENNLMHLLPGFFFFFPACTLFGSLWRHIRRETPGNRLVDRKFSEAPQPPPHKLSHSSRAVSAWRWRGQLASAVGLPGCRRAHFISRVCWCNRILIHIIREDSRRKLARVRGHWADCPLLWQTAPLISVTEQYRLPGCDLFSGHYGSQIGCSREASLEGFIITPGGR